jgi:molybdenum cofactor cytidylyltransferase
MIDPLLASFIETRVSAILLAAGSSRRMPGCDKLLLPFAGKTLLQRAVELLDSLPFFEKILVTTKARFEHIDTLYPTLQIIINPDPEMGKSGSIKLGLKAASGEWFLFLAADQPLLTPDCLLPMLKLANDNPGKIVFPSINGDPCSPTLFPAHFQKDLMCLEGDTGGRAVRSSHPDECLVYEAENPEDFLDIDNEEVYRLLCRQIKNISKA